MMRKLFVALLVGAVAVGLAAPAFAADLKFTGAYRVRFQFDENLPCMTKDITPALDCSGNDFQTRFRPRFDVETDGGVRGVLRLEIGDVRFGGAQSVATTPAVTAGKGLGGGAGADGVNVETKWAYIDFPIPATPLRLRAGIQPFFLSKALFLDDDGSGLSLYGKIGEINANFWWARANDESNGSFLGQLQSTGGIAAIGTAGQPTGSDGRNARDLFALDLSFSPYKDLNLNAYVLYDHDSDLNVGTPAEASTGIWFGVGGAGKVNGIRYDLDFVYGDKEIPHPVSGVKEDQKGWMFDGGVGMALPGTPFDFEVRGWYATGWDGTGSGDVDAFPVLYAGSGGHEPGTQVWGGGGDIDIDATADNPQNTYGVGLIARYTVSPTLKLTGNVHYIGAVEEGTAANPAPAGDGFLFGVDQVGTEFGVKIDYTIFRGLVFTLTAGHLVIGEERPIGFAVDVFDDVTKVAGVLNYGF